MRIVVMSFLLTFISCSNTIQKSTSKIIKDSEIEYLVEDILIETRDGAEISGIMVRNKNDHSPKPVILQFTIYVNDQGRDLEDIKRSVDKGYVGVVAYTRGKRYSNDEIVPYETVGNDCYDVIDWISSQKWSDQRIGMFGGSYDGFAQWAVASKLHPALKTIVPYVAARPGMGLPMENNVFMFANYQWAFYVGNNKFLDTIANNGQRTRELMFKWWESGAAFNKIDSIDQRPNRFFRKNIQHPSYDEYWQRMGPYEDEFAQIDIPVLTFDGYFNPSQNSSLYNLRQHYKYNKKAENYLIIGPYGHFGAQHGGDPEIGGYKVDKDALINTNEITYQWFDHIFKNEARPDILKDAINYQVMGANQWKSAPSLDKMSNAKLKFYLDDKKTENFYSLSSTKPTEENYLNQSIDLADRESWYNNNAYPASIIKDSLRTQTGFRFISEPMQESILVNGSFTGEIVASINKKDLDIGVTLMELMPNGEYFHLSYIIYRASYSKDISNRNLLTPGLRERIPFSNTHLVSKQLSKGSRLVVCLDVNKIPFYELNYGSGKPVAEETIQDAKEPLEVKWFNDSFVEIPIWREK